MYYHWKDMNQKMILVSSIWEYQSWHGSYVAVFICFLHKFALVHNKDIFVDILALKSMEKLLNAADDYFISEYNAELIRKEGYWSTSYIMVLY